MRGLGWSDVLLRQELERFFGRDVRDHNEEVVAFVHLGVVSPRVFWVWRRYQIQICERSRLDDTGPKACRL